MMLVADDTEKGEYVRHDELLSLIEFHSCTDSAWMSLSRRVIQHYAVSISLCHTLEWHSHTLCHSLSATND
jgi:hypothetical protein